MACFVVARSEEEIGDAAFGAGISGAGAAAGVGGAISGEGRGSAIGTAGASAAVLVLVVAGRERGRGTRVFARAVFVAAGLAAGLAATDFGLTFAAAFTAVLALFSAGAAFTAPVPRPRSRASPVAAANCAIGNLRGRFIAPVIPCPCVQLQRIFSLISLNAF
jgi:hypothetical protein